jgi:dihydroxyacetone synthase
LTGKPVLVNIRTVIGHSSKKQNTGAVHGAALGDEDVRYVKEALGFNPEEKFVVPPKVYDYFEECKPKGAAAEAEWNKTLEQYAQKYPAEHKQLQMRLAGKFAEDNWREVLPAKKDLPAAPQPTRKSSGIAVQALVPKYNSFVSGSADLMESTFVNFKGQVDFQNVSYDLGRFDAC